MGSICQVVLEWVRWSYNTGKKRYTDAGGKAKDKNANTQLGLRIEKISIHNKK